MMAEHDGTAALIIKASLLKTPANQELFSWLMDNGLIYEAYLYNNRNKMFGIDSREEFAVIYLSGAHNDAFHISLNLDKCGLIHTSRLHRITGNFLRKVNPLTGMIPNVSTSEEIGFLTRLYETHKCFHEIYSACKFGRLVHLTNHSSYITRQPHHGYIPIYEGKFIEQYNGMYASFAGMSESDKYKNKASAKLINESDIPVIPPSRFFIEGGFWKQLSKNFRGPYSVMWRSLTSATNRRTMIATILPHLPACQSIQLLQSDTREELLQILALFNSLIFDYIVRLKMVGLDLTQTIIKQIPVPDKHVYDSMLFFKGIQASLGTHIYSRVFALLKNDPRLDAFFADMDLIDIPPIYGRKRIMADIDSLIAHASEITGEELKMIALQFDKFYSKKEAEDWF